MQEKMLSKSLRTLWQIESAFPLNLLWLLFGSAFFNYYYYYYLNSLFYLEEDNCLLFLLLELFNMIKIRE